MGCNGDALVQGVQAPWGAMWMHWCRDCRHHGDAMGMHWCRHAGTTGVQWGCNGDALVQGCWHHDAAWPCCCCRTPETPCPSPCSQLQLLCISCNARSGLHAAPMRCSPPSWSPQPTTEPRCARGRQRWDFARLWGCHAAPPADLEALLADLSSFLLLLDRESLSAAARAKKRSVAELLRRLQGPAGGSDGGRRAAPGGRGAEPRLKSPPAAAEDAEYMMMRCLSPPSGVRRCRDGAGESLLRAEL